MAVGVRVITRGIKPNEQRYIAGKCPFINHAGNSANGVEQNAGGVGGEIARNVRLRITQHGIADLRLFLRCFRQNLANAAPLIAGNHHDRAILAANLLIAAKLSRRQFCHCPKTHFFIFLPYPRPAWVQQIGRKKEGSRIIWQNSSFADRGRVKLYLR